MKKLLVLVCLGGVFMLLVNAGNSFNWSETTTLSEIYESLGYTYPHKVDVTLEKVKQGKELVETGYITKADGSKTKLQSKHFKCTHCHNTQQEDPVLTESNPDTRLDYAIKNNLPFMTGTTLWGIVNRESWYNDDYINKYGDLVRPAHNSLREATQLCATECSQGRALEDWEMEAVLAYFYSIQITLGDILKTKNDWEKLEGLLQSNNKQEAISFLKSKYLLASPATFEEDVYKLQKNETQAGNPIKGESIYDLSCRTCHYEDGPAKYIALNHEKITFKLLQKHLDKHTKYSIYNAIRKGTYSHKGHRTYMPLYTKERMSDNQIEDLRAYIEQQANR